MNYGQIVVVVVIIIIIIIMCNFWKIDKRTLRIILKISIKRKKFDLNHNLSIEPKLSKGV